MEVFPLPTRIESLTPTQENNTIKTPMENGAVTVRPRYSRGRYSFELKMAPLTVAEYNSLVDFYNVHQLYNEFLFTDPADGLSYYVRFDTPLSVTKTKISGVLVANVTIKLAEV